MPNTGGGNDLTIDKLMLEVASDSAGAEKSIDRLTASLMGLNTSLKKIGNNAGAVRNVVKSLSMLSTIKIPSLTKMVNQLEKLGMINFSNLDKLKFDINLSGLSDAEKKAIAVRNTLESFKPQAKEVSKQLQQAFNLDSNATAQVRSAINQYYKAIAEGGDKAQRSDILQGLQQSIISAGSVARTTIDSSYSYLNEKQKDFLQDFGGGKKIYIPAEQFASGDMERRLGENLQHVVTNAMKGVKIDDNAWQSVISNYGNGQLFQSGELENLKSTSERVAAIINKVKELRDVASQRIPLSEAITSPDVNTWQNASNAVSDSVKKAISGSRSEIEAAMQGEYSKFSMQIPLDVTVDQARFENQIRAAVQQARQADYGKIDVDLKVSTDKLKNSITQALSGANVKDIQGITTELFNMISALREMNQMDVKSTGLSAFVGSLSRLSKESKNFDVGFMPVAFKQIADGIKGLSGTEEVAKSFGTFINSINRFVGSSKRMKETADAFPYLTKQIYSFFETMSQMGIPDETVRMIESLAEISRNGRKAGAAMQSLGESARESGIQFSAFNKVTESIKFGFKSLLTLFKKFGSGAVTALKSVISKIKELGKTKDSVNTLHFSLKNLLTTLIGFHGIRGVFNWTKDAIKAGADLTEIDHIVESVYGNMSDSVKNWADNMIEDYGIASSEAKRYAGTLTAMAQASGVTADKAAALGMNLTEAAGDLSAFFNIGTAESFQKIQSGLAGQVRPLRALGIDLSVATLKEYALEQGITKSYTAMTQAEKVMLRYSYIMNVLRADTERGIGVLGDYSRTQYSFANSSRKLMAYLSAIKTQIGAGLAAAIRPAIVALNTLMSRLLKAAQAFAAFMKTLFPFKNGASGLALGDAAAYTDDMADSADSAADGFGDADDAVKKLKKDLSVLPFDELNQLNKDRESATSGKGSGAGAVSGPIDFGLGEGLFDLAIDETKKELSELEEYVNDWAKRIKEAFDKKDWDGLGTAIATGINDGIEELYRILDPQVAADKINPFVDAVSTTLNSLITAIHWNTLGKTIGNGVNIIVNAANRLIDPETGINWTNIGTQFADGANGFVDQVDFDAVGTLFANKFNIFWEVASGFVNNFNWEKLGAQMSTGANGFIKKIDFHAIKTTFTGGINGLTEATQAFLKDFKARDFGAEIKNLIVGIIDGVKWNELGDALAGIWNKAWEFLAGFISGNKSNSGLTVQDAISEKLAMKHGGSLKSSNVSSVGNAIHDLLEGAINGISVNDMTSALSSLAVNVADGIATAIGDEKNWKTLGGKVGSVIGGVLGAEGLGEKGSEAVNAVTKAILDFFKGAVDGLSEHGEDIKNNIVRFFKGVDWASVMKIVGAFAMGKFVLALPTIIGAAFIKSAIEKELLTLFGGVASGGTMTTAGTSLFSKLGSAVKTVFSKTGELAKTLGQHVASLFKSVGNTSTVEKAGESLFSSAAKALSAPLAEAGFIALVVEATKKVQNLNEAIRGGNGFDTDGGWAIQQYINKLGETNKITGETKDALFNLKEQWENGEMDDESFYSKFGEILKDGGLSADSARGAINELRGDVGNFSDEDLKTLDSAISNIGESSETTESILGRFGLTGKDAYDGIKNAINELDTVTGDAISRGQVDTYLETFTTGGNDAKEQLGKVLNLMGSLGIETGTLRTLVDQKLGTGVFAALTGESETASTRVSGFLNNMKQSTSGVSESIDGLAEKAKKIPEDIATGVTHTQGMPSEIISKMSGEMLAKMTLTENGGKSGYEESAEGIPQDSATGIETNAKVAVDAAETLSTDMHDAYENAFTQNGGVYLVSSKEIPQDIAKGIVEDQHLAVEAIQTLCNKMKTEFNTKLNGENGLGNLLHTSGATLVSKIISGMGSKLVSLGSKVGDVYDEIAGLKDDLEDLSDDFYNAGQDLADSFADGLSSVSIPIPDIRVSSWTPWTVETADQIINFDIPNFTANWKRYAKGGFFNRPLAGILGEAGDEAAIPLENRHVMSRIASAIVENSGGGFGVSKQDIVDAVVYAMAANANNQPPINVTATLYTEDNEVLARSVERGQRSRNMRFNPTTAD